MSGIGIRAARRESRGFLRGVLTTCLLGAGTAALAQEPAAAAEAAAGTVSAGDTAFILLCAAMVLLMTPGLALFYAGMVRTKNVLSVLMQSFVAMGIVSVVWTLWGYSLAFGESAGGFIGSLQHLGLAGVAQEPRNADATIPHQLFMVFQMMFAIITVALISGAVVERMKFSTYVVFIALWATLVYVPLAHWVWGGGWIGGQLGALDFAGGLVVHISSGVSALVLALMLGKRKAHGVEELRPHNLPMVLTGTALLWFGWFGFNAGSQLAADGIAASAFVVTHLAAAAAATTWILIEWVRYKKPSALGFATGAVAGLVAITPAAGFVGPLPALVIGAVVSFLSFGAIQMKSRLGYDDALDVFGVHGVGGIWGALATGLFASTAVNPAGKDGLLFGNPGLLVAQVVSIIAAIVFAAVMTALIAGVLRAVMGLRANAEEESAGLDLTLHGEEGYAPTEAAAV